ncbi:hypothetical protein FSO04_24525 [Paraburkholderia madseniana]|jgi:hypothetical protein|uniref:Uncharacterized protein n=1 Tax=Paraburkholderia madseniana TaxID=2599607 RepID=A0A6N6WBG9_9BURK|nr:hypothetical protein [Paraburkholderia madseniana]KAE8757248.1 hypothetical protein FSO04_24525 [Paraburkholderia madseniana]
MAPLLWKQVFAVLPGLRYRQQSSCLTSINLGEIGLAARIRRCRTCSSGYSTYAEPITTRTARFEEWLSAVTRILKYLKPDSDDWLLRVDEQRPPTAVV